MDPNPVQAVRRHLQHQRGLKSRKRAFLLFVVLPAWLGPGLLDWYFHRRTHIEEPENGGALESLVHATMFAEAGVPLLVGASFEMNPLVVALMSGAAILHELTAMADVRLALRSSRRVSQLEQHTHSFLEVMPFWVVPLMALLHRPMTTRWTLTRRPSALSKREVVIVVGAIMAMGVLPYSEEMGRCLLRLRRELSVPPIWETVTHDGAAREPRNRFEAGYEPTSTAQEAT